MILVKCFISRYDETITNTPFETIKIDEVEVEQPEFDNLGERFAANLIQACREKGYVFKFYSRSQLEGFKYEIVVYPKSNYTNQFIC